MVPDRTRRLEAAYVAVAALVWVGVLAVFFALALALRELRGDLAGAGRRARWGSSWRFRGTRLAGVGARPGVLLVPALVTIGFLTPALYAATLDGFEAGVADKVALLVLLLGLLAPQLALVAQVLRRRWLPAAATLVAALIGVGLILAGDATSGYDAEHPGPTRSSTP